MSEAYRCEECGTEPRWTLVRVGDVVTTWACALHLDAILERLQRDREVTTVQVTLTAKAHEWAEISRTLEKVVRDE